MANKKISELPELINAANSSILLIVSGGVTQKISVANLKSFIESNSITTTGLSTIGAIPYVSSVGVISQSPTSIFLSPARNLLVGTNTDDGVNKLQVAGSLGTFATKVTGEKFTATGTCSNSTTVGGSTAGSFISNIDGVCEVTVIMGSSIVASHKWAGTASNLTNPNNIMTMTASNTTSATFSGITSSGDEIVWMCLGF
jgi:hypothetical protein